MKRRFARGFTLIELGVVLAVTAILAAAIVPDYIEGSRNKMVQKAATDVALIHDAARWFFAQSFRSTQADYRGRWPGQKTEGACENNTPRNNLVEMVPLHYLTNLPRNPWGRTYEAQVVAAAPDNPTIYGGRPWGCSFEVGTDVPKEVTSAFKAFLPNARCNEGATPNVCYTSGTVPSDFRRCCAFAPPPGAGWCPPGTRPKPGTAAVNGAVMCCGAAPSPGCP